MTSVERWCRYYRGALNLACAGALAGNYATVAEAVEAMQRRLRDLGVPLEVRIAATWHIVEEAGDRPAAWLPPQFNLLAERGMRHIRNARLTQGGDTVYGRTAPHTKGGN
jgi:hypothetical protein